MDMLVNVSLTIIAAATPLLLAAIGELVVERSGVLNLGVEGMMIVGAVLAFAGGVASGSAYVGLLCAVVGGMAMAALFSLLVLKLATNQVATGLATTLVGLGLAGLIGQGYVGNPGVKLESLPVPVLSSIPVLGPLLFDHSLLVYLAVALVVLVAWVLSHTRLGLMIRAIGENHGSAHALGHKVTLVRFCCLLFGGACAGLAGAFLALVKSNQWVEGMTAGAGWIAVALVVFAAWRPWWVLMGSVLFGAVTILQIHAQAANIPIPSQFLNALPYLATVVVLVIISSGRATRRRGAPACLGQPFLAQR